MGKAHSNALHQAPHFFDIPYELRRTLLCGRDQQGLDRMASRWGWEETATDWRAAVERADIDVVDIATPNHLHAPIALAALEAGKIVWCEKPLATTLEESARMAQEARGRRTLVWFNYRRVPAVAFARQLVDQDRIGRPFHYRATYLQEWGNDPTRPPNWKVRAAEAGSGVLGDLLSHSVDTALYLNGPIAQVSAMQHTFADVGAHRDIDDATLALARFANGSVGTFEATRFATGARNRNGFELHGANGAVRFNLEDLNRLEFVDATESRNLQGSRSILVTGPDHPYWSSFWKPAHIIGYEHTFIATLADFLFALAADQPFHPDFADAHRVQEVLDAMAKSARSGSAVACP
jgi:predicted dehydrogenase